MELCGLENLQKDSDCSMNELMNKNLTQPLVAPEKLSDLLTFYHTLNE